LTLETDHQLDQYGPLAIMGTEGLILTYAQCCKPIPGDPIIGHISAGRGIVIHTDTCRNMQDLRDKPDEVMTVRWDPTVDQEFSVELRLELEYEKGIIAILASTITNEDANIERIGMIEKDARLGIVNVVIAVRDRVHLAQVIKRLRLIKAINRIVRTRN
jgi:guanosine-3',5'-bis(diphosphate) 3'-pyrophosphohydrolase